MDQLAEQLAGPRQFIKESVFFLRRSQKPDRQEFLKIAQAVALGFLIMGSIGYLVKLIHIPINNIIVGV